MANLHIIKNNGKYILFHTASSSFFEISEELYKKLNEQDETDGIKDERVLKLIEELDTQALLEPGEVVKYDRMRKLTFLCTKDCNLKCRYCFANPNCYSGNKDGRMPLKTYKDALSYSLEKYTEGIERVMFFGGEPLLAFEEIKQFVPYCIEEFTKRNLRLPHIGLVTNGTVFTDEMADFFNEYDISVTISLDGSQEINDKVRVSNGKWSVYNKISDNVKRINQKRKFLLHTEMTLNKQHVLAYQPGKAAEWIDEIYRMGFNGSFVGPVDSLNEYVALGVEDEMIYKSIYREIVDYCFNNMCGNGDFMNLDIIRMIQNLSSRRANLLPCSAGLNSLTVTKEGNILPCYVLSDLKEFSMENIYARDSERFDKISKEFSGHYRYKPHECEECWMRNICGVWCRGFNIINRKNIKTVSPPRCWTSEALLEGVLLNIAEIRNNPEKYGKFRQNIIAIKERYKRTVT